MAEKKKMTVAEMLAAARKADATKGGDAPAEPAAPPAEAPVESVSAAAAPADAAPAAEAPAAKPKPAAAPGAKPSIAEVLALARANKAAAAAAPAAPVAKAEVPKKEAAPKEAKPAAKAAPAKPAGPKDTASILAAARSKAQPGPISKAEAATKAPAAKPAARIESKAPKLAVPPMPAKPPAAQPKAKGKAPADEGRRNFVLGVLFGSALGVGFSSMAATFTLWTLGTARFMFPNILTEPPSRFKVGFPSNFAPGQVETRFVAQFGVWVVNWEYNGQRQLYALRTVCTHLGCTPNWLEGEQKFKCPCHGSGFYKDGINFEGPAPRPLERYAIRLADDGQLEIDKSKIFQEEVGQWADPSSFVPV